MQKCLGYFALSCSLVCTKEDISQNLFLLKSQKGYGTQVHVPNTVKPNNVEMSELGADKGLLQSLCRAKRQVTHALKIPELPESFQESPFIGKVERLGHG